MSKSWHVEVNDPQRSLHAPHNIVGYYIADETGGRIGQSFVNCSYNADQALENAGRMVDGLNASPATPRGGDARSDANASGSATRQSHDNTSATRRLEDDDTPRTNAKLMVMAIAGGNHHVVFASVARDLERELRGLQAQVATGAHDSANYPDGARVVLRREVGESAIAYCRGQSIPAPGSVADVDYNRGVEACVRILEDTLTFPGTSKAVLARCENCGLREVAANRGLACCYDMLPPGGRGSAPVFFRQALDAFQWCGDHDAFAKWYGERCPIDAGEQISVPTGIPGTYLRVWVGSWIIRHEGKCYCVTDAVYRKFIAPRNAPKMEIRPAILLAGKVLEQWASGNWGGDIDGGQLQEWLIDCGLVDTHILDAENMESLAAQGYDLDGFDVGDTYYTYTGEAEAARAETNRDSP